MIKKDSSLKIGRVSVLVDDLEAAARYYCEALGMRPSAPARGDSGEEVVYIDDPEGFLEFGLMLYRDEQVVPHDSSQIRSWISFYMTERVSPERQILMQNSFECLPLRPSSVEENVTMELVDRYGYRWAFLERS